MTIRYNDGRVDPRPTIEHGYTYHQTEYARQVNPDLTITTVEYDNYTATTYLLCGDEKEQYRILQIANIQANEYLDSSRVYEMIRTGDTFITVKGRKYAKGTEFTVTGKYEYLPTAYTRFGTYYLKGFTADGEPIKVALANCLFTGHDEESEEIYYECERSQEYEPYGASLEPRRTYGY